MAFRRLAYALNAFATTSMCAQVYTGAWDGEGAPTQLRTAMVWCSCPVQFTMSRSVHHQRPGTTPGPENAVQAVGR